MEEVKTCTKCGTTKLLSDFAKKGNGYKAHCNECAAKILRDWRKANPEKSKEQKRRFYRKNGDRVKVEHQQRYANLSLDARFNQLIKSASRRKNIECCISTDDLYNCWQNQNGLCAYTKLPLTSKAYQLNTVSLDRIDSGKDYTADNIQLVCVPVNRMKLDMTEDQFINLCRLVAQNSGVQTPDCTSP